MAEVKTQKIILKRSSVAGKIPTADQLDPGELAINLADGLLTSKDTENNIIDLNSPDRPLGIENDGSMKGAIESSDSVKTALSKIENNILDNELVTSTSLNELKSDKVDKSSIVNSNPTLSFGSTSTVGSIDGKEFKVTMPANPNTDTKVTSAANHYAPTSVTYTPTVGSAVTWGGAVVTGITKDDKGHIVGVTTGTIPGSPSSTTYTFANGSDGSFTVTPSSGTAQKVTIGKPSTAGTSDVANRTNSALTVKVKSGTTEGVDQYTFNGSSAKSLDIKAGTNVTLLAEEGSVTISSTNTDTKYSAGTGLSLSGTTINHSNSVTAGTDISGTSNVSNTVGTAASISIPYFSYDAQGHITKSGTKTLTINTEKNTDTHYTSKNIVGASATASANAAASNGSVFINHLESNSTTPTSSHKIIGSGATTVVSDASGNITINSTNTTYGVATTDSNGLMSSGDKTKLDGIASGANNYVHPTTSGNKHIPSGGSSGQILRWSADGTAVWGADTDTNTTYTFTGGTNSFQVTPSGGSAQVVAVTPSVSSLSTSRTISLTGAVTGSVSTDFSSNASIATTLAGFDASKITSGTISIDRLPKGALERLSIVANTAARLALTTATVQNGDTVKQTDTGVMYYVKDDTKLSTEAGWEPYSAGTATSVPWSGVTGKPSTFTPTTHNHTISQISDFPANWDWSKISNKPTSYTPSSHTQAYTTLTGSTTTANQAIVSNGTANGWTLKTLGSNAFNSTAIPTNYAGSSSAGGAATSANKVNTNLVLKVNSGTTEGTNQYTFNGSAAKTLDIKAGSNVTLTATAGVLTIASTNTVYSLPTATSDVLGGVKTGSNITNSSGTISITKANVVAALGYTPPTTDTNTTYSAGSNGGLSLSGTAFSLNAPASSTVTNTTGTTATTVVSTGTGVANRNYAIYRTTTGQPYVTVPWTDSNTTYSAGTGMSLSGTTFNCTVVNTDTKVTAVGNHYTPSGGTTLSASGGGSLTANSSQVVTGITRDAAGHITGITSGKLPADNNTTYTFANGTNGFTVTPSGGSAQTVSITINTVKSPDGTKVLSVANTGSTLSGALTVSDRVNSVDGFYQTSDKRLKENVVDLGSVLNKIDGIPTVNFNYISDEDKKLQIGTIADEVEKIFPELVSKGSDGYKTVDYSKFSIIALSAIKELSKKVDELSKKVNGL